MPKPKKLNRNVTTVDDILLLECGEPTEAEAEEAVAYQKMINSGLAWRLQGSTGRAAMDMIKAGYCMLGKEPHNDYWGNYVPARSEIQEGAFGSRGYVEKNHPEILTVLEANGL